MVGKDGQEELFLLHPGYDNYVCEKMSDCLNLWPTDSCIRKSSIY